MTTSELKRRVRSAWDEIKGNFYLLGTTTSNGNAGGTTFVATGLTALDDFYNQKEVVFTSGNVDGQRRLIDDFDAATDTATIETAGWQVESGVTFEIGEKGFWSDREFFDWANDGIIDIQSRLSDEVLFKTMNKTANLLVLSAGVAQIPGDFDRLVRKVITIDGNPAPVIDEYGRFLNDSYLTYKAIFRNATLEFRPSDATTITAEYLKYAAEITNAVDPAIPVELHQALADYIIHRGWAKQTDDQLGIALSAKYKEDYLNKVKVFNEQIAGRLN